MKIDDVCESCRQKQFSKHGQALVQGVKFFTCIICKEQCANYADGQDIMCQPCCNKNNICTMCGRLK